jgi:hypothetical protein
MKDLFVLTADADVQAIFRAILARPEALGTRPLSSVVDRHPYRDSGVFRNGPELLRAKPKNEYGHFIVALDHHGSGCNSQPDECGRVVQERLDSFTFKDRSHVVFIAPELEKWLWHKPSADPKEEFRRDFLSQRKRQPRPQDFEEIASRADLNVWELIPSFRILKETLQNWFPRT